jgi:peptidoglycan LD-endopeptidase CwlK
MKFSAASLKQLITCDERLQRLFFAVLDSGYDCTIVCGHRGQADQDEACRTGKSKLRWPNSLHNSMPSLAVDVAPYYLADGIPWADKQRFVMFAGYVLGVASQLNIPVRWGGDWNGDHLFNESFVDMPHFELTNHT